MRSVDSTAIKIFINYRRSDSRGYAGWLEYCLEEVLDSNYVFRDVDNLRAGEDFMKVIARFIRQCDVVLCLIGPTWASAVGPDGRSRLEATDDPVRLELETAFRMGKKVVPVLIEDALMPAASELPDSLAALPRINAYRLSDSGWKEAVDQLLVELSKLKEEGGTRKWMPGSEIYKRVRDNDRPPMWVGRAGGSLGVALARDFSSAKWKKSKYEVRFSGPLPGRNWFPSSQFVELADAAMAKRAQARARSKEPDPE